MKRQSQTDSDARVTGTNGDNPFTAQCMKIIDNIYEVIEDDDFPEEHYAKLDQHLQDLENTFDQFDINFEESTQTTRDQRRSAREERRSQRTSSRSERRTTRGEGANDRDNRGSTTAEGEIPKKLDGSPDYRFKETREAEGLGPTGQGQIKNPDEDMRLRENREKAGLIPPEVSEREEKDYGNRSSSSGSKSKSGSKK